jgi:hypothetical protein
MAKSKQQTAPATTNGNGKKKCPLSKAQFTEQAKLVEVRVDGAPLVATPKEFATGSFGFFGSGKATIMVGGTPVPCQVSINITAIGSKPE